MFNDLFNLKPPAQAIEIVVLKRGFEQGVHIIGSEPDVDTKIFCVFPGEKFTFPDPDTVFVHEGYSFCYYQNPSNTVHYFPGEQIDVNNNNCRFLAYWNPTCYSISYVNVVYNTDSGSLQYNTFDGGSYPSDYTITSYPLISNAESSNQNYVFDQWAVYDFARKQYSFFQHYYKEEGDNVYYLWDKWETITSDKNPGRDCLIMEKRIILEQAEDGTIYKLESKPYYAPNDYILYNYDSMFSHISPSDLTLVPLWRKISEDGGNTDNPGGNTDNPVAVRYNIVFPESEMNAAYSSALTTSFTADALPLNVYSEEPSRRGYEFGGYYTSENPEEGLYVFAITDISDIKDYIQEQTGSAYEKVYNIYLYPKWILSSYSIAYYDEDGTELYWLEPAGYDVENDVHLPAYEKDGKEFAGWMIENTQTYLTDTIEAGSLIGNINLVAVFDKKIYKVNLVIPSEVSDYNVMWPENYSKTFTFETGSLTLPVLEAVGYTFDGWYKDSSYEELIYIGILYTSNYIGNPDYEDGVDVYAKFVQWPQLNSVSIELPEFSTDSLELEYDATVSYTSEEFTVSLNPNTAYTTISWYVDGTFSQCANLESVFTGNLNENITVTAQAEW